MDSHVTTGCSALGWLGACISMLHPVARSYARTRSGSREHDLGRISEKCETRTRVRGFTFLPSQGRSIFSLARSRTRVSSTAATLHV